MQPMKRAFSTQGALVQLLQREYLRQSISPISYKVISERSELTNSERNSLVQFQRRLHVTTVNRDLEVGLKSLGAGIAATGVIGSGIGLGIIFGNLLGAIARNPSIGNKAFTNAIMGAAFCESLGLFAVAVAFVIMA